MSLTPFSRELQARALAKKARSQLAKRDDAGFTQSIDSMKAILGLDAPALGEMADKLLMECVQRDFLPGAQALASIAPLRELDDCRDNAFFVAIESFHEDIIRAIAPFADPGLTNRQGRNALMISAMAPEMEQNSDLFEAILARANIHETDLDNCDALFFAAESNHPLITRRLAALGADPLRKSAYGRDAFEQALLSRAWASADELVPYVAIERVQAALATESQMNPVPAGQMPRARALLESFEIREALSQAAPSSPSPSAATEASAPVRRL